MKKVFALILALVMVFSLSGIAFAAEDTIEDMTQNAKAYDVNVAVTEAGIVYYVEIVWEAFDFTYAINAGTWNPKEHTYDGEAGWKDGKNSAPLTVSNHSNADVKVTVDYAATSSVVPGINVSFTGEVTEELLTAAYVGLDYDDADKVECSVNVAVTDENLLVATTPVAVGTITVIVAPGT